MAKEQRQVIDDSIFLMHPDGYFQKMNEYEWMENLRLFWKIVKELVVRNLGTCRGKILRIFRIHSSASRSL